MKQENDQKPQQKGNSNRSRKSLSEHIWETLITEAIQAIFAILGGLALAYLIYYCGLKP